jgi:predicted nucleotidyltransferase
MELIERNRENISNLCENHKVKELYLFGSVLSEKFNNSSDIDMLVQFSNVELLDYFDNYMDLKEKFEQLLNRPVDLVENQTIKNPVFRKIVDRDKVLLYERKSA